MFTSQAMCDRNNLSNCFTEGIYNMSMFYNSFLGTLPVFLSIVFNLETGIIIISAYY